MFRASAALKLWATGQTAAVENRRGATLTTPVNEPFTELFGRAREE